MDENLIQTNLNTVKEMILDEHKLVTYVSISKELCIHVNDCKSLLSKILKDIREKQSDVDLNVSYIISGLSGDNKARTVVISENELESRRKTFKIVFFEHIYSISKGLPAVDEVAFLAINKFEDLPLCTGIIKNSSCSKRTLDEIGNLKIKSEVPVLVEQKLTNPIQKKIKEECKDVKNEHKDKGVTKIQQTRSEPVIKNENLLQKNSELIANSKQNVGNKKNGTKSQKGITGFFNKSNSVPSKIQVKDTTDKIVEVVKTETEAAKVQPEGRVEEMEVDNEVVDKKETKKKVTTKDSLKNKSLNQIKKNAKVDKKRKRLLHVSDSESETEKDDPFAEEPVISHESDDEIPPTPSINTVKITSGIVNPKKRRKIVDKTYTDDEGYILTKKVEVYESGSDNEEEVHVKENVQVQQVNKMKLEVSPKGKKTETKISKKKMSSPQKGKQATLMSFFKKV